MTSRVLRIVLSGLLATAATGALLIAVLLATASPAAAQAGSADPHAGHDHGDGGHGQGVIGAGPEAAAAARAERARAAAVTRQSQEPRRPTTAGKGTSPDDVTQSSGKGMAVLFWLFALTCVGGSLFVITRRNLIAAVMGMVGTFFGVAALYMMLYAHFLAVVQMLVYAGAIMVLFVFVIMVLNRPEDDPWVDRKAMIGKLVALVAMGYLVLRLVLVLTSVIPPDPVAAALAPRQVTFGNEIYDWGSTAAVGKELFTDGLFPFEAISILLLVAVVGAVAIARPLARDDSEAAKAAGGNR
jgi:NADH-quinone oxidoreductase subunit J